MSAGKVFSLPMTFPTSTQKIKGFKNISKSTNKVIELKLTYSTTLKAMAMLLNEAFHKMLHNYHYIL